MNEKNQEDNWMICPKCKTKLKQENIKTHMKLIHNKIMDETEIKSMKTFHKKRQEKKKSIKISIGTIAAILIILVAIGVVAFFILSGSPDVSNNTQWLDDYTPTYSGGTGSANFWINFPAGSPYVNQSINHLTWITEDLEEKPVVFVCHRTGCAACTPQADRVKALREIYAENAVFLDLDYPFEGYGTATQDTLNKFYEAFYYDSNGEPNYIAFTGVFTLINDGGDVKIGWHSWEGDVADADMETWIKDAIYYYHINSGD